MKKELLIYIGVSVISFLLVNGILFIFMKDNLQPLPVQETSEMSADSLTIVEADTIKVIESTKKEDKDLTTAEEEYQKLLKLKRRLLEVYSGKKTYTAAEIDSIIANFSTTIDELSQNQRKLIDKLRELKTENESLSAKYNLKNDEIQLLENRIASIKSEYDKKLKEINSKDSEEAISYLASTYDTMDPKQVAMLMQNLSDEKVIKIMKKMNQRKLGKVLAAMPMRKSAKIINEMTD